jgi:hypothetical protein
MCWGIKLKNNDASVTAAILTSHFIFMVLGTLLIDIFSNPALTHKENGNTNIHSNPLHTRQTQPLIF